MEWNYIGSRKPPDLFWNPLAYLLHQAGVEQYHRADRMTFVHLRRHPEYWELAYGERTTC